MDGSNGWSCERWIQLRLFECGANPRRVSFGGKAGKLGLSSSCLKKVTDAPPNNTLVQRAWTDSPSETPLSRDARPDALSLLSAGYSETQSEARIPHNAAVGRPPPPSAVRFVRGEERRGLSTPPTRRARARRLSMWWQPAAAGERLANIRGRRVQKVVSSVMDPVWGQRLPQRKNEEQEEARSQNRGVRVMRVCIVSVCVCVCVRVCTLCVSSAPRRCNAAGLQQSRLPFESVYIGPYPRGWGGDGGWRELPAEVSFSEAPPPPHTHICDCSTR